MKFNINYGSLMYHSPSHYNYLYCNGLLQKLVNTSIVSKTALLYYVPYEKKYQDISTTTSTRRLDGCAYLFLVACTRINLLKENQYNIL